MQKTEILGENIEKDIPNLVVNYTVIRFSENKTWQYNTIQVILSHHIHRLSTYRSRIWYSNGPA